MHWRRKWQPTPVFLPGESQGRGSLAGCHLWGRSESDTTEATQQQQQQQQPSQHTCSKDELAPPSPFTAVRTKAHRRSPGGQHAAEMGSEPRQSSPRGQGHNHYTALPLRATNKFPFQATGASDIPSAMPASQPSPPGSVPASYQTDAFFFLVFIIILVFPDFLEEKKLILNETKFSCK